MVYMVLGSSKEYDALTVVGQLETQMKFFKAIFDFRFKRQLDVYLEDYFRTTCTESTWARQGQTAYQFRQAVMELARRARREDLVTCQRCGIVAAIRKIDGSRLENAAGLTERQEHYYVQDPSWYYCIGCREILDKEAELIQWVKVNPDQAGECKAAHTTEPVEPVLEETPEDRPETTQETFDKIVIDKDTKP